MKFGVYSMRDSVSGLYNSPTFEQDDAIAVRSFRFAVNKNDFLQFNAKDVDLYRIGTFDNTTGVLEPCDPAKLVDGVALLEK